MKGDFQVRFCERLKLKCFGLLDRCINGHFIAINIIRAGQASLGFCLLTFTFLSLIIIGSGQDEQ